MHIYKYVQMYLHTYTNVYIYIYLYIYMYIAAFLKDVQPLPSCQAGSRGIIMCMVWFFILHRNLLHAAKYLVPCILRNTSWQIEGGGHEIIVLMAWFFIVDRNPVHASKYLVTCILIGIELLLCVCYTLKRRSCDTCVDWAILDRILLHASKYLVTC